MTMEMLQTISSKEKSFLFFIVEREKAFFAYIDEMEETEITYIMCIILFIKYCLIECKARKGMQKRERERKVE